MTKMMSAAAAAYLRYSEGFMTCVDIKVQLVLQFVVSRGRSEVFLSILGRVYLSEVVSKFDVHTGLLQVRPDAGEHVHGETTTVVDGDASAKFVAGAVGPAQLFTALYLQQCRHLRGVRSRRPVV